MTRKEELQAKLNSLNDKTLEFYPTHVSWDMLRKVAQKAIDNIPELSEGDLALVEVAESRYRGWWPVSGLVALIQRLAGVK